MKFDLLSSASGLALASVIVAAVPSTAQAGLTLSGHNYVETAYAAGSPLTTDLTYASAIATLDQLDPSLLAPNQHLVSITAGQVASYNSTVTMHNSASISETFKFSVSLSLTSIRGTGAPSSFPNFSASFKPLNFTSGSYTLLAGGSTTAALSGGPISDTTSTITTLLSAYLGTGTFQVDFASLTGTTALGGGGNVAVSQTTTASPGIYIWYNITTTSTSAPEPATLAVFGAAMAGLGVMRRRKKA